MGLSKLGIRNLRNLEAVDISPSPRLNLIYGANASGKTSVLEAIYYLGRARSFRTRKLERIIRTGTDRICIYGTLEAENHQPVPLGLERSRREFRLRIDGQDAHRISELVARLPVQLIHPNSHKLLEEGPRFRREYLDWGVFHVEHSFYPAWKRYQRSLKQRNMALRTRTRQELWAAWDHELVEAAREIHQLRTQYLRELVGLFPRYLAALFGDAAVELNYYPGWPEDRGDFAGVLQDARERDREQGYTGYGPHRADLLVTMDGKPAVEQISRGQQKILVTALLLTQAGLFNLRTGKRCLLLIDDVAAELDRNHRQRLMQLLTGMDVQLFVTAIEPEALLAELGEEVKMFHVEHGNVQEIVYNDGSTTRV